MINQHIEFNKYHATGLICRGPARSTSAACAYPRVLSAVQTCTGLQHKLVAAVHCIHDVFQLFAPGPWLAIIRVRALSRFAVASKASPIPAALFAPGM